jgi:hypothetical protein
MCIGVRCGVGINKAVKADLSQCVDDEAKGVVQLEPRVPSGVMGGLLPRYLEEGRSLDGWDTLFRGLQATSEQENLSNGSLVNLTKRVNRRSGQ